MVNAGPCPTKSAGLEEFRKAEETMAQNGNGSGDARKLRSQLWFDNPDNPA